MALRDYLGRFFAPATNLSQVVTAPIRGVAAQEHGVSGTENYGGVIRREDYNPDFDNWEKAVALYDKMRRSDAQVRAMLQVIKLPLRGASWQVNPSSQDPVDKQIADFCNGALFDDDSMEDSWDYVLRHILLQLEFGVSVLEKVWKVDEQGFYRFKRLAPRLAKTLKEWHVNREGKLVALVQYAPVSQANPRDRNGNQQQNGQTNRPVNYQYGNSVSYQYLTIPAEYCALFTLEREGDNYEGYSLLRNVYRNWYFKDEAYRVMGVGLDRWGVGIPVAALEEGHSLSVGDKLLLRDILQSVRANERAYMVMPEHVNFKIEPQGQGQGTAGQFGINWIEHNDTQMARNVLASFLTTGQNQGGGSHLGASFGSRLTDMFISSLDGIAGGIAADIKTYLIKPLCDFNFDMSRRKYPTAVCMDLDQVDLSALIDVMAKLQGTVITPQDDDENLLRKMLGLPPLAPTRSREAKTKDAAKEGDASAVPQPGDGTNPGDATNPNRPGPNDPAPPEPPDPAAPPDPANPADPARPAQPYRDPNDPRYAREPDPNDPDDPRNQPRRTEPTSRHPGPAPPVRPPPR